MSSAASTSLMLSSSLHSQSATPTHPSIAYKSKEKFLLGTVHSVPLQIRSYYQTTSKAKECQEQDVEKEAKLRLVESQSRVQFVLVYNSLLVGFIACFAKVCLLFLMGLLNFDFREINIRQICICCDCYRLGECRV